MAIIADCNVTFIIFQSAIITLYENQALTVLLRLEELCEKILIYESASFE